MNAKIMVLLILGVGALLEVIGDMWLKKWALTDDHRLLFLGMAIYFIGSLFWIYSLKLENLSSAISIFVILNLVMAIAVGVFVFHEKISPNAQLGMVLGIVAVALIEFG